MNKIFYFAGVRDYIHIQDLADGHVAALKKIFEPSYVGFKPYNLGTGKGHSVLEVITVLRFFNSLFYNWQSSSLRSNDWTVLEYIIYMQLEQTKTSQVAADDKFYS